MTIDLLHRTSLSNIRAILACILLLTAYSRLSSQTIDASGVDANSQVGISLAGVYSQSYGAINLTNGNLFFSLPLVFLPGRAHHDVALSYIANSKSTAIPFLNEGAYNPNNGVSAHGVFSGWRTSDDVVLNLNYPRLVTNSFAVGEGTYSDGISTGDTGTIYCNGTRFIDSTGSSHLFKSRYGCASSISNSEYDTPISESTDGSMLRIDATNQADIIVYRNDGSSVHFKNSETDDVDRNGNIITYIETNGYLSQIIDTVGRHVDFTYTYVPAYDAAGIPTYGTTFVTTVSLKDANGTDRTITITRTLNSSPAIGFAYTCSDSANQYIVQGSQDALSGGSTTIIQYSGATPRTYALNFDAAGELTRITYPSGGYVRYEYADNVGPQRILGNYTNVDCSQLPHRQISAQYECGAASGSCGKEIVTTYTPTIAVFNTGENAAMDVRNSDGRTHYDFTSVYGYVHLAATLLTKKIIYQGESDPLQEEDRAYTTYDHYTMPLVNKVTNILYANGSAQVTSNTSLGYLQRSYACPLADTESLFGPSCDAKGQAIILQTPVVRSKQIYDYSGTMISDEETTFLVKDQAPLYLWPLTQVHSITGMHGDTFTTSNEFDNSAAGLQVTGAGQHRQAAQQRGNITKTTTSGSQGGSASVLQMSYDDAGNMVSILDARNYLTSFTYNDAWSSHGCASSVVNAYAYLTSVTNPLQQKMVYKNNYCSGLRMESIDSNGSVMQTTYDDYQRLTKTVRADGGVEQMTWQDMSPASVRYDLQQNVSGGHLIRQDSLNGYGRILLSAIQENPNAMIKVAYSYDDRGRRASMSQPFDGTASSDAEFYTYDALSRLRTTTQSSDNTSIEVIYRGNVTDKYDQLRRKHTETRNALDQLTSVVENENSGPVNTAYVNDVAGNLLSASQASATAPNAVSRLFAYDSLSRLVTSNNPETGVVCYGTVTGSTCTSGYDGNGNLLTKTDARGIATSYSYDSLNRLTAKQFYAGGRSYGPSSCYVYDQLGGGAVPNSIGRLTAEWTQNGPCPQGATGVPTAGVLTRKLVGGYDAMGRITSLQTCVLANCSTGHPQNYTYDLAGNLVQYTDGRAASTFTQAYDSAGRLLGLTSSLSDALHPPNLFNVKEFDPLGWKTATMGDVMKLTRTYDNRMRVSSQKATAGVQ